MRWLLFDEVLETHVCHSLARALQARGQDVVETGAVWQGHRFPRLKRDQDYIFERLEAALACKPDVVFVFRASTLTPKHLKWLKAQVPILMVWLPDDPVLYRVYGAVVDHYDWALHGGGDMSVLRFYDQRGHRPGVMLPFWAGRDRFPYAFVPDRDFDGSFVFFGNCAGPSKRERYQIMKRFSAAMDNEPVSIFGRVDDDPQGWSRGYLDNEADTIAQVSRYRSALNIPQKFSDYIGTLHDFYGLGALGYFDVASRVVQLGSLGLPQITLGPKRPSPHFPTLIWELDGDSIWQLHRNMIADTDLLVAHSLYGRRQFEKNFTADARAEYLLDIISEGMSGWSLMERCFNYKRGNIEIPHVRPKF